MRLGKLTPTELEDFVLRRIGAKRRSEVVLSAAHGEDCAALKLEDLVLLSTDPITVKMPLKELGRLSVDVACNDIVANGGEPIALLFTVIIPCDGSLDDIESIMNAASTRAKELDVDIVGGHTEFSDCVTRAIVSVTAIGSTKRLMKKADVKLGDKIYLTKYAGIEGTLILSESLKQHLNFDDEAVLKSFEKKLSVKLEGMILNSDLGVTTMHDVTEGGVIGAVLELVMGARLGAVMYEDKIPVHPLTKKLCNVAKIDPLRLISSGALLFTASNLKDSTLKALKENGIELAQIGEITDSQVILKYANGDAKNVSFSCDHLLLAKT